MHFNVKQRKAFAVKLVRVKTVPCSFALAVLWTHREQRVQHELWSQQLVLFERSVSVHKTSNYNGQVESTQVRME